jgi:hypothetical protein
MTKPLGEGFWLKLFRRSFAIGHLFRVQRLSQLRFVEECPRLGFQAWLHGMRRLPSSGFPLLLPALPSGSFTDTLPAQEREIQEAHYPRIPDRPIAVIFADSRQVPGQRGVIRVIAIATFPQM